MSTYKKLSLADIVSQFPCSFVMNVRRLWMAPSCVLVGQLTSQRGVEWAMCMPGVLVAFSLVVPSFTSVSAISFPVIPKCAFTLCMWTLYGVQYRSGEVKGGAQFSCVGRTNIRRTAIFLRTYKLKYLLILKAKRWLEHTTNICHDRLF